MARIFITGSSDGLGRMAAQLLVEQGHNVVLHARNQERGQEALRAVSGAETVLIGDLTSIAQICGLADQANRLGSFNAVIHNAGVGYQEPRRITTEDGLPHVFAVNILAPLHPDRTNPQAEPPYLSEFRASSKRGCKSKRSRLGASPLAGQQAYSDTKQHDVLLAFAVARRWQDVLSNAVEPGWVATKMGGPEAPDDLDAAHRTQVWLATSDDQAATVTGKYFYHKRLRTPKSSYARYGVAREAGGGLSRLLRSGSAGHLK